MATTPAFEAVVAFTLPLGKFGVHFFEGDDSKIQALDHREQLTREVTDDFDVSHLGAIDSVVRVDSVLGCPFGLLAARSERPQVGGELRGITEIIESMALPEGDPGPRGMRRNCVTLILGEIHLTSLTITG
jgi:hypothetical protein